MMVLEDIDWTEQRAATGRTGACEDACLVGGGSEIVEEVFVSPQLSAWFLQAIISDSRIATSIVARWR